MTSSKQKTVVCLSCTDSDEDRKIAKDIEMYIKKKLKLEVHYVTPPAHPGEVDIYIPIISKEFFKRNFIRVPVLPMVSIIPILVDIDPSMVGRSFADAWKLVIYRKNKETFEQELEERIRHIFGTDVTIDVTINLLLLGKKSYYKRFTGNQILGMKMFDPKNPTDEVEKQNLCSGRRIREFRLQNVTLTDVPAIKDTAFMANEKRIGQQLENLKMKYDGILLVFCNPVRDTPEEQESMEKMVEFVGEEGLKENGFIVITDAMDYEDDAFSNYLEKEVKDAKRLSRRGYNHLGSLIKLVGEEKCLCLDNRNTSEFVEKLLQLLDSRKSCSISKYHFQHKEFLPKEKPPKRTSGLLGCCCVR